MTKNTKNPAQKLTRKDKNFLNKIINNYRDVFFYLITRYRKPTSFWRNNKNLFNNKNKKALIESIISIKNDILPQSFEPKKLNKVLRSWMLHDISRFSHIKETPYKNKRKNQFVTSSNLSDSVFPELKKIGIEHIAGKRNIKKYYQQRVKKNASKIRKEKSAGKPSIYNIPKDMEYAKNLLEKPLAIEYIKNKVSRIEIFKKIPEYYSSLFIYIAKSDENLFLELLDIVKMLAYNEHLDDKEIMIFKKQCKFYQLCDDKQMEIIMIDVSNYFSNSLKENKFYKVMSFLFFFNLIDFI